MAMSRRVILAVLVIITVEAQDPSSTLLGLISSIASTSTNPNCPGECHHAMFSAMFCTNVLDNVDCGGPQLKCCIPSTTSADSPLTLTTTKPVTPTQLDTLQSAAPKPAPPQLLITPFSIVTNLTVRDEIKSPSPSGPSAGTRCPGVCVAPIVAEFCVQVLEDVQCTDGNRCCTMRDGATPVPLFTTPLPAVTSTSRVLIIRGTTPVTRISEESTPPTTESTVTEEPSTCDGSCVAGFLSLLCDDIDQFGTCPGTQRCCVVRRLVTTTPNAPARCPGYCMPALLSGMCNKPSRLVPETTDCDDGTICCDNSAKDSSSSSSSSSSNLQLPARPSEFPLFPLLLNAAQTALQATASQRPMSPQTEVDRFDGGGFGRGCPVPCIATFLSLTCFGDSILLENIPCPKEQMVCCVPKNLLPTPPIGNVPPPSSIGTFPITPLSAQGTISGLSDPPGPDPPLIVPFQSRKATCGLKTVTRIETPRIMGGQETRAGEWCWQAALINAMNQYLCGGALIGTQWVLTAAHCVTNLIRSGETHYVRVGDYDLTNRVGSPGAQTLRVATTYVHHSHNSQTLDNNIALLKLAKHVDLREGVCLICLPARGIDVVPGKRCSVTGYGYEGENGPIPLKIREAELPIVAEAECVRKLNVVTEKVFVLPTSSFCAGGEQGNDACQGDGGGPMACEEDGFFELTGIISWGFGCGRQNVPGVYVKVSSYIGWINDIISINNS